ncbi:MAG TPA: glycosyl hydrolase family 28-related protein, partial [Tichowtungia sp.]|nr:glycosyl hydrolase family 28-related protein [Tichowtungia sp.]
MKRRSGKRTAHRFCRIVTGLIVTLSALPAAAQVTSVLWGADGEAWNPTHSVLRDFTDVGYRGGAVPIPGTNDWTNAVSVLDYGAIPDDHIDDSDAFIAAISNCPNYSAVLVPKGRYLITKIIRPQRDHFVLRGEDMYESILFFPKYTSEIYIEEVGWQGGGTLPKNTAGGSFITFSGGEEKSIENLTLEFREQRKISPWEYIGANAIGVWGVSNSWARNIYIKNYDGGLGIDGKYLSFINIIFDQFNGRQAVDNDQSGKLDAYSAIMPRNMNHILMHNIDITGTVLQPIDNNESNNRSVYSKISTGEMNNRVVGLHGGSSQYHLYTELNKPVVRDAEGIQGPSWSYCTYWNVNGELPGSSYSNSANSCVYVGFGDSWPATSNSTFYYEPAAYGQLIPTNMYLAQLNYFGKPLPEGPVAPPPKPYEREGDVFRVVPDDDAVPDQGATGTLQISSGAYFKFDLSQATETNVAAARFRLTMQSLNNAPYTVGVFAVTNDNWAETNLTTANKPAVGSELDSQRLEADGMNYVVEVDVTSFVRDQLVGGDGVVSLYATYTQGSGYLPWAWCAEQGQKPELIVEREADSVPGAPSAPKGIRSTPLVGNIMLDWDDNAESDIATYNVYRSPSEDGWLPQSGGLVTSDHVDVSSTEDWHVGMMDYRQVYRYWITAVDEHGYESGKSKEFVAAVVHPSNAPPAFSSTVSLSNATALTEYSEALATEASDPESDPMYFMKVSGPDWLNVALDGTLSGVPELSDAGTSPCTFQVTAIGGSTQKVVNITVELPADDPPGAPAAPTNLVAGVDYNTVRLEWDDNVEADLAGYYVYRSRTSGNYGDAIATNSPLSSAYVDSTAVNGTTYYYAVAAFDSNLNISEKSREISATPVDSAPSAPTGLAAAAGDNEVRLVWNGNIEGDLAGYSVYRSTTSSNYSSTALASNIGSTSYVDSTAVNGTTYYYVVTAIDVSNNESDKSSEASATPAEPDIKVVAYYPFNSGSMVSEDTETNSVAGDMVVGTGVTTFKWETREYWTPTRPSAAFDAGTDFADETVLDDDYFSFTITPEAGVMLDFSSLSFTDRSGGFSVSVASDQDGFATVIDSVVAAGGWATNTLDLSFLSRATNATEIRLYFHNGNGNDRMID